MKKAARTTTHAAIETVAVGAPPVSASPTTVGEGANKVGVGAGTVTLLASQQVANFAAASVPARAIAAGLAFNVDPAPQAN